jgi:hypothetical protein
MAAPLTMQAFGRLAGEVSPHRPSAEAPEARVHTSHPELSLTLGNYGLTDVDLGVRRRRGVAVPVSGPRRRPHSGHHDPDRRLPAQASLSR